MKIKNFLPFLGEDGYNQGYGEDSAVIGRLRKNQDLYDVLMVMDSDEIGYFLIPEDFKDEDDLEIILPEDILTQDSLGSFTWTDENIKFIFLRHMLDGEHLLSEDKQKIQNIVTLILLFSLGALIVTLALWQGLSLALGICGILLGLGFLYYYKNWEGKYLPQLDSKLKFYKEFIKSRVNRNKNLGYVAIGFGAVCIVIYILGLTGVI